GFTLKSNPCQNVHNGECDKVFSQKSNFIIQQMIHAGKKPFHCDECDYVFTHKKSLIRHRMAHMGKKPYQ
ncbi:unnamed protein product, partial [Staurois parvus]